MKIHFIHPFSLEKNYGKELNATMAMIPDGDWCAIMDWDAMLLCHEQIERIYKYVEQNISAGMFVCKSNRSGSLGQRLNGRFEKEDLVKTQHWIAQNLITQTEFALATRATEIKTDKISGFLMLISKATWNEIKFNEELKILDVDRDYARRLIALGKQIFLMDSIYIWHSYRIWKDVKDKTHLL